MRPFAGEMPPRHRLPCASISPAAAVISSRRSLTRAMAEIAAPTSRKDTTMSDENGLIGYWPLRGDCRDHSGHGHHGINHGVDLASASFDGRGSWIEVPDAPALR